MTADEDLKKRYEGAASVLAELLNIQTVFVGKVKLVADNGTINVKALGYIYGLTDCALQTANWALTTLTALACYFR